MQSTVTPGSTDRINLRIFPTPRRIEYLGGMVDLSPPAQSGAGTAVPLITGCPPHFVRSTLAGMSSPPRTESLLAGSGLHIRVCCDHLPSGAAGDDWNQFLVPARCGEALRLPANQAYTLTIRPASDSTIGKTSEVEINASYPIGVKYALQTLAQLLRTAPWPEKQLPCVRIEDEPTFGMRGLMLDISRCRVPTQAHLMDLVRWLSRARINHLQLYTEHTFAYRNHREVWDHASPLTAEEIRELDAFAASQGVELSANQNCFGHLTRWLKLPGHAHLAETHGSWIFDNGTVRVPRNGPFSLCPTDEHSHLFVAELLNELMPCFQSRLVNIGCDETFDVGSGRSAEAVRQFGRSKVYFDFVGRIAQTVRHAGNRPMMWADIALTDPEALAMMPQDMIALAWGYEPDTPFAQWCDVLKEAAAEREVWVCPGTSAWRSLSGRTTERRANLSRAALEGAAHGARGFLITEWGDDGHRQQWPIAWHAILDGANCAWNAPLGAAGFDADLAWFAAGFDSASNEHGTRESGDGGALGNWLERLGDVDLELRLVSGPVKTTIDGECRPHLIRNAGALFADTLRPFDDPFRPGSIQQWRQVQDRLESEEFNLPAVGLTALVRDELDLTLDDLRLAAQRAILRRTPECDPHRLRQLSLYCGRLMERHDRLWGRRARPGGRAESRQYDQRIADELTRIADSHSSRQPGAKNTPP